MATQFIGTLEQLKYALERLNRGGEPRRDDAGVALAYITELEARLRQLEQQVQALSPPAQ